MLATTEKLNCGSCGQPFECGANTNNCWCFDVSLDAETLADLNQEFDGCLCGECLHKMARVKSANSIK